MVNVLSFEDKKKKKVLVILHVQQDKLDIPDFWIFRHGVPPIDPIYRGFTVYFIYMYD